MNADLSEKVLPSSNIEHAINEALPHLRKRHVIDGSFEKTFPHVIEKEPGDLRSKTPINFVIRDTAGLYLDLDSLHVEIELRTTDINFVRSEDVVNAAKKPFYINNIGQSIWSTIKVYINDVCVENNYHNVQLCNLRHLLTTSNVEADNYGIVQGVFRKNTLTPEILDGALGNQDIVNRIAFTKLNPIKMIAPLHLNIASCQKYLVDGCEVRVELQPIDAKLAIKAKAGQAFEYEILSAKLHCQKYKPYDSALISCNKYLLNNEIEYVVRRTIVHDEILNAGLSEHTINRPFGTFCPPKLYIWMTSLAAVSGVHKFNPYAWETFDLSNFSVKINGAEIDNCKVGGSPNLAYHKSKLANGGDYFTPHPVYTNNSFFVVVDCRLQSDGNSLLLDSKGSLSITLRFGEELEGNVKVYVMGEVDSSFNVDNDRSITCNYQI